MPQKGKGKKGKKGKNSPGKRPSPPKHRNQKSPHKQNGVDEQKSDDPVIQLKVEYFL